MEFPESSLNPNPNPNWRLFQWNSIMLELEGGIYAEYVHIQTGSATVRVGDRVEEGSVLCASGDVGFCPVPHLHLQLYPSRDTQASSLNFKIKIGECEAYLEQGYWYGHPPPSHDE